MADVISPSQPSVELVTRLLEEGPIGMAVAARQVGVFRQGKPTHTSTLTRWIIDGVPAPDGGVVRLEGIRVNGRWMTSRPALIRFLACQQGDAASARPKATAPAIRPPATRRRASEAAGRELEQGGV